MSDTQPTLADLTPAQAVEKYIALRRKKEEIEERHKKELEPYKVIMKAIEGRMMQMLQEAGVNSMKAPAGTFFQKITGSTCVEDWANFLAFVQEAQAWEFLEKRANKTAVQTYLEENQKLPPGIKMERVAVVQVRAG